LPRWIALLAAIAAVVTALGTPAAAPAHPERPSAFPDGSGSFPKYRTRGPSRVVCKRDSRARIRSGVRGKKRRLALRLLERCRYRHIQAAVNAARNGDRILVLPGVYREEPSRAFPERDPRCWPSETVQVVGRTPDEVKTAATYEYQVKCPNDEQLIAIIGDSLEDEDRKCDSKCRLQIEGIGDSRDDVLIEGDQSKLQVIKGDRADGLYLRNFTIQYSDFNNVYVMETDGFRFDEIVSRWSNEYGFLTFASDHGIYEDLEVYGHGDSGVYPGSGPETRGERYGIHIRRVDSHDNLQGDAGAAANGVWFYDNDFHHNQIGFVVDSFSPGHPGSPQDSARWTNNRSYSNNRNYWTRERLDYCRENRDYEQRDPTILCPKILVPIGVGLLIAGGNDNVVEQNRFWDNHRYGAMQIWVEAAFRGERDPALQNDTSHRNRYVDNVMGVAPDGSSDPNGVDFWWDEQGEGNCWEGNTTFPGRQITSNPGTLATCASPRGFAPANPVKHASLVPCATANENDESEYFPPGCDWYVQPPEPR